MSDMLKIHNKITFIEALKEAGYDIPYITFLSWEKKGLIVPDAEIPDGKRTRKGYTEKAVGRFIERLPVLNRKGKIRLSK